MPPVVGGRFKKGVTFDDNLAIENGGAFAAIGDGSLTFKKPWVVRTRNNELIGVYSPNSVSASWHRTIARVMVAVAVVADVGSVATAFDIDF